MHPFKKMIFQLRRNSSIIVVPPTGTACGDIFLPSSNYTGEDLYYVYSDCDTGISVYVTVPYGSPGITVYGRV